MIVQDISYNQEYADVYNFTEDNSSLWHQGGFNREFYKILQGGADWIIFPRHGYLYLYHPTTGGTYYPVKVVYNIRELAIVDKFLMSDYNGYTEVCGQIYIPVSEQEQANT